MLLYLGLTILTLFAVRVTKSKAVRDSRAMYLNGGVLLFVFLMLFFVSAFRGNVGNDYYRYTEIMNEVRWGGVVPTEWGFNLIVYVIYVLSGFNNYRLVFAFFSFLTVFLFLYWLWKRSEDFTLSFALFMLSGYYFQSFSTVRYYAALPMALIAYEYCKKGDYPRFVLTVIIAASLHKSALVVLVLYPLASIAWKKIFVIICAAAGILVAAFPGFWMKVAVALYPTYDGVASTGDESSPLNIVRCALVILLALYVGKHYLRRDLIFGMPSHEDERDIAAYTRMSIVALAMYVFGHFMPQISRLAFYVTLPQLLLIPSLIKRVEEREKRRALSVVVLTLFCLLFVRYLSIAGDDGILVLPYRSFLFE